MATAKQKAARARFKKQAKNKTGKVGKRAASSGGGRTKSKKGKVPAFIKSKGKKSKK